MSTAPIIRTHPLTGAPIVPVGRRRDGRTVWPILGGAPDDWPAFMPGAGDDPHGPRAAAAQLLDGASTDLAELSATFTDAALPEAVRGLYRQASGSIMEVRQHTHRAAGDLDQLAATDLYPAPAQRRLIRERKALTAGALREVDQRSEAELAVLEKALTAEAQPTWPAGADKAEARERFRLLADAAGDPSAVVRALVAGTDAELSAVAASSYARTYLESRGVDEAIITATATYAAQAAVTSGDPRREAAGKALAQLDRLKKARQKSLNAANFAIAWADG